MGVRNNKIFMYGAEVPYGTMNSIEKNAWDKYEVSRGIKGEIGFVSDGMGGQYEAFGMIIENYEEDFDFFPEGIIDIEKFEHDLIEENKKTGEDDRIKIMKRSKELFGKTIIPHVILINHYS